MQATALQRQRLLDDRGPAAVLQALVDASLADLPQPGAGRTLERWQALEQIAAHDLSLAKLFEGHTDALAVLHELGATDQPMRDGHTWGLWAAEAPGARVHFGEVSGGRVRLNGRKAWCSGAAVLSHALLTVWASDGRGPFLAAVALAQPGVQVTTEGWHAVGMSASGSVDVVFDGADADLIGGPSAYLQRPGFWQGGAGIATCWYAGAVSLARHLRRATPTGEVAQANPLRRIALGRVDLALQQTAMLIREAAAWIDANPRTGACEVALRVRLSAEASARCVLDEVGRSLGAAPFCRDPHFSRMAADLPVFVRQSGGDRDFAALGERVVASAVDDWAL